MPYPPVHLVFFSILLFPIALYGFARVAMKTRLSRTDWFYFLLLLSVGGFFTLFPDIFAVWNLVVYGKLGGHCSVGSIPTHSILFASIAFFGGALIGFIAYRDQGKALALGLFAEASALFHLILDDLDDAVITYLYPLYNEPFTLFSFLEPGFASLNFSYSVFTGLVAAFYMLFVMIMAFKSLSYLGFGFRFESHASERILE